MPTPQSDRPAAVFNRFLAPLLCAQALLFSAGCAAPVSQQPALPEPALTVNANTLVREPWTFGRAEGLMLLSDHFRVFTTETNSSLRDDLVPFLEHAMAHYRTFMGDLPAPEQKLDVYFMDSRQQWMQVTQQLMGERAALLMSLQRGGFASRGFGVYFDIGKRDSLMIAGHEGWHQFTQSTFQDALPIWLEEGLATLCEGFTIRQKTYHFQPWKNTERFDHLVQVHRRGDVVSIAQLMGTSPEDTLDTPGDDTLDFYAQVWAFAHFLREGQDGAYRASFEQIIADAQNGKLKEVITERVGARAAHETAASRRGDAVIRAYITEETDRLDAEYQSFVRRLVQLGHRDQIVAGQAPQAATTAK